MPELPDVTVYVECLQARVVGQPLVRVRLASPYSPIPKRRGLAAFDFPSGTVLFTEEGTKKRASLHVVGSATTLRTHDRGGLEVLDATAETFREALLRENHTVKRALTDPRLFSGIGNAYSDEILHAARLSPLKLTRKLTEADMQRLFEATRATLEL